MYQIRVVAANEFSSALGNEGVNAQAISSWSLQGEPWWRRWSVLSRATIQRSIGLARDLFARVPIPPKFEWLHVSLEVSALFGLTRGTFRITAVRVVDLDVKTDLVANFGASVSSSAITVVTIEELVYQIRVVAANEFSSAWETKE